MRRRGAPRGGRLQPSLQLLAAVGLPLHCYGPSTPGSGRCRANAAGSGPSRRRRRTAQQPHRPRRAAAGLCAAPLRPGPARPAPRLAGRGARGGAGPGGRRRRQRSGCWAGETLGRPGRAAADLQPHRRGTAAPPPLRRASRRPPALRPRPATSRPVSRRRRRGGRVRSPLRGGGGAAAPPWGRPGRGAGVAAAAWPWRGVGLGPGLRSACGGACFGGGLAGGGGRRLRGEVSAALPGAQGGAAPAGTDPPGCRLLHAWPWDGVCFPRGWGGSRVPVREAGAGLSSRVGYIMSPVVPAAPSCHSGVGTVVTRELGLL